MKTRPFLIAFLFAVLLLVSLSHVDLAISQQSSMWQPYADRYAIIVMGGDVSVGSDHYRWYWADTYGMYTELKTHGFTDANIYFLSYGDSADAHSDIVDAVSTTQNIKTAYQWAQDQCTDEDLLYIFWVDHGSETSFETNDGTISHSELGTLTQPIVAEQILGAYNPCYSGAVIDDISRAGVITTTSQDASNANSWGWAGYWRKALRGGDSWDPTDTDGDGYISMTEAYLWICWKSQAAGEHPMYDDNGDGVGHECTDPGFDPDDPSKDGHMGKFYSLDGHSYRPHLCGEVYDGNGGPLDPRYFYLVTCDVVVPQGAILTIEPGTEIYFGAGCKIIANGTLNASGERGNPSKLLSEGVPHRGTKLLGDYRLQNGGEFKPGP
jgi:hypothetical protein